MSDLWIHWKGMFSEWDGEPKSHSHSHPHSIKERKRWNKVGKTAIKILVVVFLMRFTSCASTSKVLFLFFSSLRFFSFKYIFVVSKKFAFSILPHQRFAFLFMLKRRKRKKGHWRKVNFSIVLLKHSFKVLPVKKSEFSELFVPVENVLVHRTHCR